MPLAYSLLLASFCLYSACASSLPQDAHQIRHKVKIGTFESRGLWSPVPQKAPSIILIPGSGAHGPQQLIEGKFTLNGQHVALFDQISSSFHKAGFNVLSLGKPGVEIYDHFESDKTLDNSKWFYNETLYRSLVWQDLITNLSNAVSFIKSQPSVDPQQIYILGHSEGTQVAIDYADQISKDTPLAGLVLLGFFGHNMKSMLQWQAVDRIVDYYIKTDVDLNQDSWITRDEVEQTKGNLRWEFLPNQDRILIEDMRTTMHKLPVTKSLIESFQNLPIYSKGIFERDPIFSKAASLKAPLYLFTGEVDMQTPLSHAETLIEQCQKQGKTNCFLHTVANLGHTFSPPRPPRAHPILDLTLGPIDPNFLDQLSLFARSLLISE